MVANHALLAEPICTAAQITEASPHHNSTCQGVRYHCLVGANANESLLSATLKTSRTMLRYRLEASRRMMPPSPKTLVLSAPLSCNLRSVRCSRHIIGVRIVSRCRRYSLWGNGWEAAFMTGGVDILQRMYRYFPRKGQIIGTACFFNFSRYHSHLSRERKRSCLRDDTECKRSLGMSESRDAADKYTYRIMIPSDRTVVSVCTVWSSRIVHRLSLERCSLIEYIAQPLFLVHSTRNTSGINMERGPGERVIAAGLTLTVGVHIKLRCNTAFLGPQKGSRADQNSL